MEIKDKVIFRSIWICHCIIAAINRVSCTVPERLTAAPKSAANEDRDVQKLDAKHLPNYTTLKLPTWWGAIDAAWPFQRTGPSRWPDPGSAASDKSTIYKVGKTKHQFNTLIDHFHLQTAYVMHMYKSQWVRARHMFQGEFVRSVYISILVS